MNWLFQLPIYSSCVQFYFFFPNINTICLYCLTIVSSCMHLLFWPKAHYALLFKLLKDLWLLFEYFKSSYRCYLETFEKKMRAVPLWSMTMKRMNFLQLIIQISIECNSSSLGLFNLLAIRQFFFLKELIEDSCTTTLTTVYSLSNIMESLLKWMKIRSL